MDKLKTLLMKHGEKIVAVVCALFGFLALTSASWDADDRLPITIEQLVTNSKAKIETNEWPEPDQDVPRRPCLRAWFPGVWSLPQ